MVPPGIPGRSDEDFLPAYDPAAARDLLAQAGYPGRCRFPGHGPDDRRVRLRRGDRRRGQARARDHAPGRDHGRRLLRPARQRSAADVGARLGRRLPGPQRLPGRPAQHRRLEQLRPLELARVRRGDPRGDLGERPGRRRRPPTTGPSGSSATRSRSSRSSTDRAGRCRGPGCSVRGRTASASSAWRGWRGRTDARARSPRSSPADGCLLALGLLLGLVPTVAGASSGTFGTPTADSTFGKGIVFSQPITIDKPIGRVEILLTFADAIGPTVFEVPGVPSGPTATLTYTLDTSGNDHMIPNTPIVAQWRVFSAGRAGRGRPRARAAGRLRRRPVRVEDRPATSSSGSTGTRATRRSAQRRSSSAPTRSARPRSCSA